MPKVKKFEKGEVIVLMGFAVFVDILELILSFFGVGEIIEIFSGIIQYGILGLWFIMHGSFFFMKAKRSPGDPKKMNLVINSGRIAQAVAESIPVIGALPIFSYSVWAQIKAVNKIAEQLENEEESTDSVVQSSRNTTNRNQTQDNNEDNSNVLRFNRNQENNPSPQTTTEPGSNIINLSRNNQRQNRRAA